MLLIPCPYCGFARPEIEFKHAGKKHFQAKWEPVCVKKMRKEKKLRPCC